MNAPDLTLLLLLAAVFAAAIFAVFSLRAALEGVRDPVRVRLEHIAGNAPERPGLALGGELEGAGWLARLADRHDEASKLRQRLSWAGFRAPSALSRYLGAKLGLAVAVGVAVLLLDGVFPLPRPQLVALLSLLTAVGYVVPSVWLERRIAARQRAISRPLPDALDLLVSCVEAGLSVGDALARVAHEMRLPAPLLAQELTATLHEIEAGLPRAECFRRLAERTGVGELRSLAAVLVQTEMFGTAIGRGLRVLSDGLRVDRLQRANERAATVGVRLTLPLILCLLPALVAVLLGGAIVRVVRTVLPLFGVDHG